MTNGRDPCDFPLDEINMRSFLIMADAERLDLIFKSHKKDKFKKVIEKYNLRLREVVKNK